MDNLTKPLTSLLIKPAGPDCNLGCNYCFYLPKSRLYPSDKKHRMNDNVLQELLGQSLEQCEQRITFSWQGGEPSLMGLDFYEKVISLQKRYGLGKAVSNVFQTNGILLNANWAKLFKQYNFLVGLSLDGPRHIHDHYRRFPGGKGSWEKVVQTANLLVQQGVAVNVLTCLTDYSVQYPEEIYSFHKDLGLIFMQFIPVIEKEEKTGVNIADYSVTPEKYANFMCRIFDLWFADIVAGRPTTSVRFLESLFFRCLGEQAAQCTFHKECGSYLVIEHNGDVYPCDFYVDSQWKLGNIMDEKLVNLLNSDKHIQFGARKRQLALACRECHFVAFCHGGCPKDRQFDMGLVGANFFCQAYRRIFEYTLPVIRELSSGWVPNSS